MISIKDACAESLPLRVFLPDGEIPPEMIERFDPLGACLLALADGAGPCIGAVAWISRLLSRVDLRGANLSEADLYEADLFGANLSRVDLSGAYLYGAKGLGR